MVGATKRVKRAQCFKKKLVTKKFELHSESSKFAIHQSLPPSRKVYAGQWTWKRRHRNITSSIIMHTRRWLVYFDWIRGKELFCVFVIRLFLPTPYLKKKTAVFLQLILRLCIQKYCSQSCVSMFWNPDRLFTHCFHTFLLDSALQ